MKKMTKEDKAKFQATVARCRELEREMEISMQELNEGLETLKQEVIIKLAQGYQKVKSK
jgi:hypothetical protein